MAKYLICPKCNDDYWGKNKGATCDCGHIFTEEEKRQALGLTKKEYTIACAQEKRTRNIPITNKILLYLHCKLCAKSLPENMSMHEWAGYEVGWTKLGLQVWCKKHNTNIIHIDFENQQHPANITRNKICKEKNVIN